jgi:hypothetical protein
MPNRKWVADIGYLATFQQKLRNLGGQHPNEPHMDVRRTDREGSGTRFRKLRIAWSVAWGIAAVLLIVLWTRSFQYAESIYVLRPGQRMSHPEWIFYNMLGSIEIFYFPDRSPFTSRKWGYHSIPVEECEPNFPGPSVLGFYVDLSPSPREFSAPHWFFVFITVALAAFPWIRQPSWRFSLRTLLIATTVAAIVIGLLVWSLHR